MFLSSKKIALLLDCAPYHPDLKNKNLKSLSYKQLIYALCTHDAEFTFQQTLSIISKQKTYLYNKVFDYPDLTDAKSGQFIKGTTTMRFKAVGFKVGPLRCAGYNSITKCMHYWFIPYPFSIEFKKKFLVKDRNNWDLRFSWDQATQSYGEIDQFRVANIEELALKTTDQLETINTKIDTLYGLVA